MDIDKPNLARQALTAAVNRAMAEGAPVFVNVPVQPFHTWTSPDGLIGIEIDPTGVTLRTREHPADMWEPPVEMLKAGGQGCVAITNAGITGA